MSNCPDCKQSILSQTPTLIGNTKCNPICPEDTACLEGSIPSSCVYYSGQTLPCTGVLYGNTISQAIQALSNEIFYITSNTLDVQQGTSSEGCKFVSINTTNSGGCQELEWINFTVLSPFISNSSDLILKREGSNPDMNLGERKPLQYAIEYCGENIKKVWVRGLLEVPPNTSQVFYPIVANLPSIITPQKVAVTPTILTQFCDQTGSQSFIFSPDGNLYFPFIQNNTDCSFYLSLDGFSYELY